MESHFISDLVIRKHLRSHSVSQTKILVHTVCPKNGITLYIQFGDQETFEVTQCVPKMESHFISDLVIRKHLRSHSVTQKKILVHTVCPKNGITLYIRFGDQETFEVTQCVPNKNPSSHSVSQTKILVHTVCPKNGITLYIRFGDQETFEVTQCVPNKNPSSHSVTQTKILVRTVCPKNGITLYIRFGDQETFEVTQCVPNKNRISHSVTQTKILVRTVCPKNGITLYIRFGDLETFEVTQCVPKMESHFISDLVIRKHLRSHSVSQTKILVHTVCPKNGITLYIRFGDQETFEVTQCVPNKNPSSHSVSQKWNHTLYPIW